jgi:hypothetical protein
MRVCLKRILASFVVYAITTPLAAQTVLDAAASGQPAAAAALVPPPSPLPEWLTVGAQYRGRLETSHGMPQDDSFYLNRIRIDGM